MWLIDHFIRYRLGPATPRARKRISRSREKGGKNIWAPVESSERIAVAICRTGVSFSGPEEESHSLHADKAMQEEVVLLDFHDVSRTRSRRHHPPHPQRAADHLRASSHLVQPYLPAIRASASRCQAIRAGTGMSAPSPADVLERGRAAQKTWSALSVAQRCASLSKARRMIAAECESIAATIAREVSKVPLDALSGDVLVTLEHMRYCEFHAKDILRSHAVDKPSVLFFGTQFEMCYEPHGVALIFGPSNYPFQLSMIPLVTALAAGNAVVLKCSERTPETANLIAGVFRRAGLPEDLVQVFHDDPEQAALLIDARPDFIFFTGSSRHGQQVAEHAARYLIPAVFELGGKDAALVFADCHFERAINGITYGAFSNAGRVCLAVKRVYVQDSIYYRFLESLVQRIADLHTGTSSSDADLCGLLEREQVELRSHVGDALRRGARLHWPIASGDPLNGPVLLSDVPADALILTEESFGPVLCIAPFTDEAEAVALANASSFALGSSLWTRNRERARRVSAQLSAGSCSVNDVIRHVANPYAAFGGNRLSGYGRYRGPQGFRIFSRTKTILRANGRPRRELHWFPFTGRTRSQLAALIRFRHGTKGLVALLGRILLPILLAALLPVAFGA